MKKETVEKNPEIVFLIKDTEFWSIFVKTAMNDADNVLFVGDPIDKDIIRQHALRHCAIYIDEKTIGAEEIEEIKELLGDKYDLAIRPRTS